MNNLDVITRNPYRVLGLLGNSTERELQKQIGITKRFAEINKFKSFDYDFEFIGEFSRNSDDIQHGASKLEQAANKLHYSLFWFVNNNQFDEIALNNLKDKNIQKAIDVWTKSLKEEVSSKNFSSYQNLSTLYITLALSGQRLDLVKLLKGIVMKGALLHSDSMTSYTELVTSSGHIIDSSKVSKKFGDEIVDLVSAYMKRSTAISPKILVSLFNTFPESIQKHISSKFTETPFASIENAIEKTIIKRKENPEEADEYGENLFNSTKNDAAKLKSLLGEDNLQVQMAVNKLADELLQCGIVFHNQCGIIFHNETLEAGEFDPGQSVLKLLQHAESLGATGQTKSRLDESIEFIQDWIDDKPNREKAKESEGLILSIGKELEHFQNKTDSVLHAKNLVTSCKPKLSNLKSILGASDEYYIQISGAVVNNALGMLIVVANTEQERLVKNPAGIENFKTTIRAAVSVMNILENLDMSFDTRSSFSQNKAALESINAALESTSQKKASEGCYIATMAYGDYDHPQVHVLRHFRDENLSKTALGRSFIKYYYMVSPYLVATLGSRERVNKVTRIILDIFIRHIKK